MVREIIDRLADQILTLENSDLTPILHYYKQRMADFQPTPEWERAVIGFFIINAIRVKNNLLQGNLLKQNDLPCNNCNCLEQMNRLRVVK